MLPIYIVGNLHCLGMCGPLVMMIAQHRFRYYYFAGRLLSFTLAAAFAGGLGSVLHLFLSYYHLSSLASFLFGFIILMTGFYSFRNKHYPGYQWFAKVSKGMNQSLSLLILQDRALPTFLFGFFTVLLPCGQTLVVFSACALAGDAWIGMVNGLAFALITSPSLFVAMNAYRMLGRFRKHYNVLMGISALVIGLLALLRGFAELGIISHLVVSHAYHIVIY